MERPLVYGLAFAMFIVALLKQSNSVKARKIKGPVAIGNNSGSINQTYIEGGKSPDAPKSTASSDPPGDRVAWAIGVIGVLVATAQLAHDVFFK